MITEVLQCGNLAHGSTLLGAAHGELQLDEKAKGSLTSRAKGLQELSGVLPSPCPDRHSLSPSEA